MSEEHKMLFVNLVINLASSTMINLGKVVNPVTKKTEVNLQAAQTTIDLLDMLEAKTKGNLDEDEARFLKTTLADIKINYVETANAAPGAAPSAPDASPATGGSAKDEPIENKRFSKKFD